MLDALPMVLIFVNKDHRPQKAAYDRNVKAF